MESLMTIMAERRAAGEEPLDVYATALRRAATGARTDLTAVDTADRSRAFLPGDWCGGLRNGDGGVLSRCGGRTLDVGCGPGRLTSALASSGQVALGIDVSAEAVRLARRRGARVLRRDVFAPLPEEGRWDQVLLIDGSIGIGGDPTRLLRRCRDVAAPDGRVVVEVDPPGTELWTGRIRIRAGRGALSAPFPWAYVGADQLARLAGDAGLRVLERWTEAERWFASLSAG